MGNYEGFLRMLNAANIVHTRVVTETGTEVSVRSCQGETNTGNCGLYTTFSFNLDGELESVGVWEGKPPVSLKVA